MDALVSYVRRIIPPTETHFIVPVIVFPLAGASIDLWFTASRYYDSSAGGEGQVITDYLSCSRASIGYAKTSTGTLTQFASNELRITDLGLLVEDARENLALYSETFQLPPWSSDEATITTNQTTAPNGNNVGARLEEGTNVGARQDRYLGVGGPSAARYTASCYFKEGTRRYCALSFMHDAASPVRYSIVVDLQTGLVTSTDTTGSGSPSSSVESMGNGWYRLCIMQTYEALPGGMYITVCVSDSATPSFSNGIPVYTGGGSSQYVYVWGAQVELGVSASSYIPTTASTATRAADVITITGNAQTDIASSTGSIVAWINRGESTGFAANVVDSNGTNLLGFNASNNAIASLVATLTTGNTANRTSLDKLGLAWNGTGRGLVLNAGTVATDASAQTPSSTQHLGSDGSANFIYAYCERLVIWTSKLDNSTLQGFTSP